MNSKIVSTLALAAIVCFGSPAMAKQSGGKVTGVYCSQGGDNALIPASAFKPNVRAKLRKGLKVKVNLAGYGPVNCTVY